jgi:hypothetical protein
VGNGKFLYACRGIMASPERAAKMAEASAARDAAAADAAAAAAADGPLAAGVFGNSNPGDPDPTDTSLAFKLHSRPGAPRTILLDFTGSTWTGTAWNSASLTTITTPPYDTGAASVPRGPHQAEGAAAARPAAPASWPASRLRAPATNRGDAKAFSGVGSRDRLLHYCKLFPQLNRPLPVRLRLCV